MNNNRLRKSLSYILFLFILVLLFFTNSMVNKVFYSKALFIIVLITLLVMISVLLFHRSRKILLLRKNLGFVTQPLLIPIIGAPLFKCSFKVPYVFCQVCPTKCPFGYMQNIILSSSVLMNFESRNWCSNVCPLGKIQDNLSIIGQNLKLKQLNLRKYKISYRILSIIGYLLLAFFLFVFFSILVNPEKSTTIINLFQTPNYSIKLGSLVILAIIFLSLFIPGLWCNYLCPVGSVWRIAKILKSPRNKKKKKE